MAVMAEEKKKKKSSKSAEGGEKKDKLKTKDKKDKKDKEGKSSTKGDKASKSRNEVENSKKSLEAARTRPAPKPRRVVTVEPEQGKKKNSYLGDIDLPSSDSESDVENEDQKRGPEKEKVFIARVRLAAMWMNQKCKYSCV
jgi:hypothetical protein